MDEIAYFRNCSVSSENPISKLAKKRSLLKVIFKYRNLSITSIIVTILKVFKFSVFTKKLKKIVLKKKTRIKTKKATQHSDVPATVDCRTKTVEQYLFCVNSPISTKCA